MDLTQWDIMYLRLNQKQLASQRIIQEFETKWKCSEMGCKMSDAQARKCRYIYAGKGNREITGTANAAKSNKKKEETE